MKNILLFILLSVFTTKLAQSQCSPNPSNIYTTTISGIKYEIIKEKLNWVDAAACAVSRGGKLAEINSKAEQDSLFKYVNKAGIVAANTVAPDGGGASYLWLGANDRAEEGKWIWDGDNNGASVQFWQGTKTGSAVGGLYNNWGNEPDDFQNQDCLGLAFTNWPLGVAGQWNDVKESNTLYYIIEYSPASSISEINTNKIAFSIFPNPANTNITLKVNPDLLDSFYTITDANGRLVLTGKIEEESMTINLFELSNGNYFLSIGNQNKMSFKVVR